MDRYEFNGTFLRLEDEELQLSLQEDFVPLLIPANPILGEQLQGHIIKMDLSGGQYLEKHGKRHGQALLLYADGSKKMECFYLDGDLHGPSSFFSEKGALLSKSWFWHGKQEGKCLWYYPSGQLYSIQRYREGQWHLLQEYFWESGQVKSCIPYKNGKLEGEVRLYDAKGKLERSIHFKNGQKIQ